MMESERVGIAAKLKEVTRSTFRLGRYVGLVGIFASFPLACLGTVLGAKIVQDIAEGKPSSPTATAQQENIQTLTTVSSPQDLRDVTDWGYSELGLRVHLGSGEAAGAEFQEGATGQNSPSVPWATQEDRLSVPSHMQSEAGSSSRASGVKLAFDNQPNLGPNPDGSFWTAVEGLLEDRKLSSSTFQTVSWDGAEATSPRAWVKAAAPNHRPSLTLMHRGRHHRVGLLTENSVRLLAEMLSVPVSAMDRMVFGRVPAGVEVESVDGCKTLLVDSSLHRVDFADVSFDRYFVLADLQQPFARVRFRDRMRNARGVVALPIIPRVPTYFPIERIRSVSLHGRAWLAQEEGMEPAELHEIRSLDQGTSFHSATNKRGEWDLGTVWVTGEFPVQIDLWSEAESLAYRNTYYEEDWIVPGPKRLYGIPQERWELWVAQLQGGVDSALGSLFVALPPSHDSRPTAGRLATLKVPGAMVTGSARPEVYSVLPSGELDASGEIAPVRGRFLGIQIPWGSIIAEVSTEPKSGSSWSKLFFSSPQTINIDTP